MNVYEDLMKIIKKEMKLEIRGKKEVDKLLKKGEIDNKPFESFIYSSSCKKVAFFMAIYNLNENRLNYNDNDYYFGNNNEGYIFYKYNDLESEITTPDFENFLSSIKIENENIFEILEKDYNFFIYGG